MWSKVRPNALPVVVFLLCFPLAVWSDADAPDITNRAHAELQMLVDRTLPLFEGIPAPEVIVLSNEQHFLNPPTPAHCHGYRDRSSRICFKKEFYERTTPAKLHKAMLHEMTHAWMAVHHPKASEHGIMFWNKCSQVGC